MKLTLLLAVVLAGAGQADQQIVSPVKVKRTYQEEGCPKGYSMEYLSNAPADGGDGSNVLFGWASSTTGTTPRITLYKVCVTDELLKKLAAEQDGKK